MVGRVDVDVAGLALQARPHRRVLEIVVGRVDRGHGAVAAVDVEPGPAAGEEAGRGHVDLELLGQRAVAVPDAEPGQEGRAEEREEHGGGRGHAPVAAQERPQERREGERHGGEVGDRDRDPHAVRHLGVELQQPLQQEGEGDPLHPAVAHPPPLGEGDAAGERQPHRRDQIADVGEHV